MALNKTNLVLVAAQLPPDFEGTVQELFEAMVERLEIQSPVGTNFFVVGDIEPSSNQGPWLKNGTQWWVFNETIAGYVPLDISASLPQLFIVGPDTPDAPGENDALLWLRTASNRGVSWYAWNGAEWRPFTGITPSGTSTQRPSDPADLEQFYDTTIGTLIWFERGAWRTVAGVPGDVKFVTDTILSTALAKNPGWDLLNGDDEAKRGRILGQASKDPGGSPESSVTVSSGITQRSAGEVAGEETHVLADNEIPQHTHLIGHILSLTGAGKDDLQLLMSQSSGDQGELEVPLPLPPNYLEIHTSTSADTGPHSGTGYLDPTVDKPHRCGPVGTMLITSVQMTKAAAGDYTSASEPHNNIPPVLYLWTLVKT